MPSRRSRRTLLRAAGSAVPLALSGCVGSLDAADFPHLSVSNDDVPVEFADVSATVARQFDADAPAEIRVAFTNTAGEEREFGFSAAPPFSGLGGTHRDREAFALLVPLETEVHVAAAIEGLPSPTEVIPEKPTDEGCWLAEANLSADPVSVPRRLAPGETLAETYALLAAPVGESPCPLEGEYRFESNSYFDGNRWGFSAILD